MLMEQPKWSYMFSLLVQSQPQAEQEKTVREIGNSEEVQHGPNKMLEKCGALVLGLDNIVRASYGGNILSEEHELARAMLLDGFFLLEFLQRLQEYKEALKQKDAADNNHDDPIFENEEKVSSVIRDLLLLENQV
ncbi:hypothetical protein VNO78_26009 [Psophocarpus tetragonolobus]|uniref:Uncharacterized protein n=1 Tax=Psophocarpus tetragonolobus TaxID=3891 RepID=A0AAN9XFX0_PSOTE